MPKSLLALAFATAAVLVLFSGGRADAPAGGTQTPPPTQTAYPSQAYIMAKIRVADMQNQVQSLETLAREVEEDLTKMAQSGHARWSGLMKSGMRNLMKSGEIWDEGGDSFYVAKLFQNEKGMLWGDEKDLLRRAIEVGRKYHAAQEKLEHMKFHAAQEELNQLRLKLLQEGDAHFPLEHATQEQLEQLRRELANPPKGKRRRKRSS